MPRFPEPNEASIEPQPETIPPHRQPPFSPNVCRCCCTLKSSAESEGNEDNDDGASTQSLESTLVASNQSDAGEDFPPSSDGPEPHVMPHTFVDLLHTTEDGFSIDIEGGYRDFVTAEGNELHGHVMGLADHAILFRPDSFTHTVEEYPDSMMNHPYGSDDHSIVSNDSRSLNSTSPGPGIAAWIEDNKVADNFLRSPLRLTHQRQYCRGLVTSHLVLHD